jgi:site-specific recombinase XerD
VYLWVPVDYHPPYLVLVHARSQSPPAPRIAMPRRELARKSKRPPRAAPASRTAALKAAGAPEVAPPTPQPSSDNQALISRYLHARDLRPNSRAAYRADLRAFAAALGPQSLLDVRADDVRTWLRDHTRDPGVPGSKGTWTPRTAARKLATLKAFYAWARETPRDPVPAGYSLAAPQPLGRPVGDPAAYLFLHPHTGRVLSRKRAWERLLLAGRAAGLSPAVVRQLSPHKLRHAIAFHALADGHTLTDVQGLLDHEDVRTTTVYVEANEQQRFRTMEELSRAGVLRR